MPKKYTKTAPKPLFLSPPPPIENGIITEADTAAIAAYLKEQCAALVWLVTAKYVDGAAQPNPVKSNPEPATFDWNVNCTLETVTKYPQTSTEVSLNVKQAIGNGTDTSFINSSWNLSVTANGFSLNFPRSGRNIAAAIPPNALNITQTDLQTLFQGKALAFSPAIRFLPLTTGEKSSYLSEADRNAVVTYLQTALQSALEQVRKHYLDGQPDTARPDEHTPLAAPVQFAPPETTGFIILSGEETYLNHNKEVSEGDWGSPQAAAIGTGGPRFINEDWALTVNAGGLDLTFPLSGRNLAETAMTLAIPQAGVQALINGKTWPYAEGGSRIALTLKAGAGSGYITTADLQRIQNFLADKLKAAVSRGTDGARSDRDGAAMAAAAPHTEQPQGLALAHTLDASLTEKAAYPAEGTLWGNTAYLDRSGSTVTIEVLHTDSAGTLNAGSFLDTIAEADEVIVTFKDAGSDRIRFNRITELFSALKEKGVAAGKIQMKGDAANPVHPLFNGDDLFSVSVNTSGTTVNAVAGKVFKEYTAGQEIFEGFKVKQNSGKWYIDNEGNKPITIERLSVFEGDNVGYLDGFGLRVNSVSATYVDNPTLAGGVSFSGMPSAATACFTPEHLDAAFGLLGLDYSNGASQLFTIENFGIVNAYSDYTPVNLKDYKTLAFLEKYMTGASDLAKLSGLSFSIYLNVTGSSNPFSGNSVSTALDVTHLNGNLAAYLGQQNGFVLKNLVIDNSPTLFTSEPSISIGILENVVFNGNWSNLVSGASGVIVSKDTPVKYILGHDLWYVLGSNVTTVPSVVTVVLHNSPGGIIEIKQSSVNASNVRSDDIGGAYAKAAIASAAQITALKTGSYRFIPFGDEYPDGARPTATWQSWASGNYDLTSNEVLE